MDYELEIANNISKGNRYKIIQDSDRHVQIECICFCDKENLGDQIFCTYENQKIWVAKFHSDFYKRIKI